MERGKRAKGRVQNVDLGVSVWSCMEERISDYVMGLCRAFVFYGRVGFGEVRACLSHCVWTLESRLLAMID